VLRQLDTLRSFAPNLLRPDVPSLAATKTPSFLLVDFPSVFLIQYHFSLSQTDLVNDAANVTFFCTQIKAMCLIPA